MFKKSSRRQNTSYTLEQKPKVQVFWSTSDKNVCQTAWQICHAYYYKCHSPTRLRNSTYLFYIALVLMKFHGRKRRGQYRNLIAIIYIQSIIQKLTDLAYQTLASISSFAAVESICGSLMNLGRGSVEVSVGIHFLTSKAS